MNSTDREHWKAYWVGFIWGGVSCLLACWLVKIVFG